MKASPRRAALSTTSRPLLRGEPIVCFLDGSETQVIAVGRHGSQKRRIRPRRSGRLASRRPDPLRDREKAPRPPARASAAASASRGSGRSLGRAHEPRRLRQVRRASAEERRRDGPHRLSRRSSNARKKALKAGAKRNEAELPPPGRDRQAHRARPSAKPQARRNEQQAQPSGGFRSSRSRGKPARGFYLCASAGASARAMLPAGRSVAPRSSRRIQTRKQRDLSDWYLPAEAVGETGWTFSAWRRRGLVRRVHHAPIPVADVPLRPTDGS